MFNYILNSLIIPSYISSLISKKLQNVDDAKLKRKLIEKVGEFQSQFNNTELDCNSFQKFIEDKGIVNRIMDYIVGDKSFIAHDSFINSIHKEAVEFINNEKLKINHSKLKEEYLIKAYFEGLIEILINIRRECLTFNEKANISILENTLAEMEKNIISKFDNKSREKHTLGDFLIKEKFKNIRNLININKYSQAENEINNILQLNMYSDNSENEELLYYKGLIEVYYKQNFNIESIIDEIKIINSESYFIGELRYIVACNKLDEDLYKIAIKLLKVSSRENTELKEVYFNLLKENFDKCFEILLDNNEVKYKYIDNDKVYFYLGLIYLRLNEYKKAYEYFNIANKINENYLYIYNMGISEFFYIVTNQDRLEIEKNSSKEKMKKILNDFKDIEHYFEDIDIDGKIQFWDIYLNLLLEINPEEVENKINILPDEIKYNSEINAILGMSYFVLNKEESENIYKDIWKENQIYTIRYIMILKKFNKKEKIKSLIQEIDIKEYDEYGILAIESIECYIEEKSDDIHGKVDEYLRKYGEQAYFIEHIIDISNKLGLDNIIDEYCKRMDQLGSKLSKLELIRISKTLYNIGRVETVERILRDIYDTNALAIEIYLDILFTKNNSDSKKKLNEIIEKIELYEKFPQIILFNRARIELSNENWEECLTILNELYKLEEYHTFSTMYYLLLCKFKLHKLDDMNKFEEYLMNSEIVAGHILVSRCYAKINKWSKAKRLSFESLYRNESKVTKEDIYNYVAMYFENVHQEKRYEKEITTVGADEIIVLKSIHEGTMNICFHSSAKLVKNEGEIRYNCKNYSINNDLYWEIVRSKKGDNVVIEEIEYYIGDIINKHTYYFRYYNDILEKKYPNHGLYQVIHGESIDELVVNLTKYMLPIKEHQEKLLRFYNFEIENGIPISMLANNQMYNYNEVISYLLYNEEQMYFSGKIESNIQEPFIFSISSIIILENINVLNKISNELLESCYISRGTLEYVKNQIEEIVNKNESVEATTYIDELGNLKFRKVSELEKESQLRFWKNILSKIKKFNVEEVNISIDKKYKRLDELIYEIDIEAIELCHSLKGSLIIDDFFISKLHKLFYNGGINTNAMGFILKTNSFNKFNLLDIVYDLSRYKYLWCVDDLILYEFIKEICETTKKLNYWIKYSKVSAIFENIFTEELKPEYIKIYQNLIERSKKNSNYMRLIYILSEKRFNLEPYNDLIIRTLETKSITK